MSSEFSPKSDFLRVLFERGFVHQCSDFAGLDAHLADRSAVCGRSRAARGAFIRTNDRRWRVGRRTFCMTETNDSGRGRRDLRIKVKTAKGRKLSSTLWLERQLNDPYVTKAKREGYRGRLRRRARVFGCGTGPRGERRGRVTSRNQRCRSSRLRWHQATSQQRWRWKWC